MLGLNTIADLSDIMHPIFLDYVSNLISCQLPTLLLAIRNKCFKNIMYKIKIKKYSRPFSIISSLT